MFEHTVVNMEDLLFSDHSVQVIESTRPVICLTALELFIIENNKTGIQFWKSRLDRMFEV